MEPRKFDIEITPRIVTIGEGFSELELMLQSLDKELEKFRTSGQMLQAVVEISEHRHLPLWSYLAETKHKVATLRKALEEYPNERLAIGGDTT